MEKMGTREVICNEYTTCAKCGNAVHNDDARNTDDGGYCDDCYKDLYIVSIHAPVKGATYPVQ